MKNLILILTLNIFLIITALAQTPPPPNGGEDAGSGNTPVGGGAPIGSGLAVIIASAGVYLFSKRKPETPDYSILDK